MILCHHYISSLFQKCFLICILKPSSLLPSEVWQLAHYSSVHWATETTIQDVHMKTAHQSFICYHFSAGCKQWQLVAYPMIVLTQSTATEHTQNSLYLMEQQRVYYSCRGTWRPD